jgi:hypothetical protein
MEGKRVSSQEIREALAVELDQLAEAMAEAMNAAREGRIIGDSEEPVRDAHGVFRQQAFEKVLSLLQAKQEAFSPCSGRTEEQGSPADHASDGQRAHRHK